MENKNLETTLQSTDQMEKNISTDQPVTIERSACLQKCMEEIARLLKEKEDYYGNAGGFYENNNPTNYYHACGEAKLKITEFTKLRTHRLLVKALAWLYLVYESEERYPWRSR